MSLSPSPLWLLATLLFGCALAKIPTMKCNLKDPKLYECVEKNIAPFLTAVIQGVPERGIKPFEPLGFPPVFTGIGHGPIRLDFEILEGVLTGLASSKFNSTSVLYNPSTHFVHFTIETRHPELVVTGQYKERVLTSRDEGNFTIVISNAAAVTRIDTGYEKREGKTYLKVEGAALGLTIQGMHLDVTSKERPDFAKTTVPLLNKIWPVLFKESYDRVKPTIEKIIVDKLTEFTSKVALEEMLTG